MALNKQFLALIAETVETGNTSVVGYDRAQDRLHWWPRLPDERAYWDVTDENRTMLEAFVASRNGNPNDEWFRNLRVAVLSLTAE